MKRIFYALLAISLMACSSMQGKLERSAGPGIPPAWKPSGSDTLTPVSSSKTKIKTSGDMTLIDDNNPAGVTLSTLAAGGGTDDQTAAEVPNTPAGNIAASDVQAAINELDTEKQAKPAEGAFVDGDKTKLDTMVGSGAQAVGSGDAPALVGTNFTLIPLSASVTGQLPPANGGLGVDASACTGHHDWSSGSATCVKDVFSSTVDPDENYDSSAGYSIGSLFYNTTGNRIWRCIDASVGVAAWKDLTASAAPALSAVANPTASKDFDMAGYALTFHSATNGWAGVSVKSTIADNTTPTVLWDLGSYDADDAVNVIYLRIRDSINSTPVTLFEFKGRTLALGTAASITGIGTINLSGGTLYIPTGANPTVDVAGKIAEDTTAEQLVYGSAENVLHPIYYYQAIVENLAAADDNYEIAMFNDAVTIVSIGVHCRGACSTPAQISLEDRAGNAMTHTTPTASTGTGTTTFQAVTAANGLIAGEGLAFDVDNAVSPETDVYTITVGYKFDRQ